MECGLNCEPLLFGFPSWLKYHLLELSTDQVRVKI